MTAKRSPWLLKQPAGSGMRRAHFACGKKRSCENAEVGEARDATSLSFPAPAGNAGPPLWRAFALWAGLSRGLAELEPCTRAIPRTAQACAIIASSSTQQAVTLARRDGTRLDNTAKGAVFLGIRTIQEQGRGMVPLYAARVQDLGIDDFVIIKCGACGHTAEICRAGCYADLGYSRPIKFST